MKRLSNPFASLEGYNCFGCSPDNPLGLKLIFFEDGDELVSQWEPGINFQGYHGILHGGIQATLMDEIASWVVYVKLKTAGFTSRADIRYRKSVFVDKGQLTLRARCTGMRRNLADIEVRLYDPDNVLCADGTFTYFTFSKEKAREQMYYPGHSSFFNNGHNESGD
jgi:acyl-coenzyme A thioesterase PaaI-like protein